MYIVVIFFYLFTARPAGLSVCQSSEIKSGLSQADSAASLSILRTKFIDCCLEPMCTTQAFSALNGYSNVYRHRQNFYLHNLFFQLEMNCSE